jgi:hypothetical protein
VLLADVTSTAVQSRAGVIAKLAVQPVGARNVPEVPDLDHAHRDPRAVHHHFEDPSTRRVGESNSRSPKTWSRTVRVGAGHHLGRVGDDEPPGPEVGPTLIPACDSRPRRARSARRTAALYPGQRTVPWRERAPHMLTKMLRPAPATLRVRRREVAQRSGRCRPILGTPAGVDGLAERPVPRERVRETKRYVDGAGQGVVAANGGRPSPMVGNVGMHRRTSCGRDVAASQHSPGWARRTSATTRSGRRNDLGPGSPVNVAVNTDPSAGR